MFAVQSSICARSSSSCQLKTQKTTSSKRVQRCHHSAVRLFCFVLCVYARSSSCSRRVLLPPFWEREKRKQIFSLVDQDVFVLLLVALYSYFIALLSVVQLLYILSSSSSQQVQVNALGVSKETMVRSSFSSPFSPWFSSLLICVRKRFWACW